MKYDITSPNELPMPKLGKGLEGIKLLLSQASADMQTSILPMLFAPLGTHISHTEVLYPNLTWKELCGQMANLVGPSGIGKGQLGICVAPIVSDLVKHDQDQYKALSAWKREMKAKEAGKKKKDRETTQQPDTCLFCPPANTTNAAFISNSMLCENDGDRSQYYRMEEIEMADNLCGSHRMVSQMMRAIFDVERAGALRATADGVTGNPILRVNMSISSTPIAARKFFKNDIYNGTFGRFVLSYKPRNGRSGKIPRVGKTGEDFQQQVDVYLERLKSAQGRFVIKPLNKLMDSMAEDMASLAELMDDDVVWDIAKRSLINAWKAGCILWLMNDQVWTRPMAELVEWLVYHDLWSKMQVFGDMLRAGDTASEEAGKAGPKNMLEQLPDSFTMTQLEALRESLDKPRECKGLLNTWVHRKFITYCAQTGLYTKTETYLNRKR